LNLQPFKPLPIDLGVLASRLTLPKLVLFRDHLLDRRVDLTVVHLLTSLVA
jgi:hypothetical protein